MQGYGAYRDLEGTSWAFRDFTLVVDRAQSDPYAPPSRMHVVVPAAVAGLPADLYSTKARAISIADFLCRAFSSGARSAMGGADGELDGSNEGGDPAGGDFGGDFGGGGKGGGKGGKGGGGYHGSKGGVLAIDAPGQHVVERSAVSVSRAGAVECRFTVSLPARGRTIEGRRCAELLGQRLPGLVRAGLVWGAPLVDPGRGRRHALSVEDQQFLRGCLRSLGLAAFVADGSVLPRASGASDAPMPPPPAGAPPLVPFASPPSLAVEVALPNGGPVRGMGIPRGVSLVVGGGFHGKSTLLEALQVGCYDKVPGDGRELCVADPTAVKVRAEDGRSVSGVDVSPFIANLPFRGSTRDFSTGDASGSTSMAASLLEALEVTGAQTPPPLFLLFSVSFFSPFLCLFFFSPLYYCTPLSSLRQPPSSLRVVASGVLGRRPDPAGGRGHGGDQLHDPRRAHGGAGGARAGAHHALSPARARPL